MKTQKGFTATGVDSQVPGDIWSRVYSDAQKLRFEDLGGQGLVAGRGKYLDRIGRVEAYTSIVVKQLPDLYHLQKRIPILMREDWEWVFDSSDWDGKADGTLFLYGRLTEAFRARSQGQDPNDNYRERVDTTCHMDKDQCSTSQTGNSTQSPTKST